MKLTLYVTSVCNLACAQCIMQHQMKADFKYQMSMDEVNKFIEVSKLSNYKFNIVFSGGEPLLWKNLHEGIDTLYNSGICNTMTMFTNGIHYKRLTQETVDKLNSIRVSHYKDVEGGSDNTQHIREIRRLYPKAVGVDRSAFWINPTSPVENYTPVKCMNSERLLYNYNIYACPHSASIAAHNGSKVKISNPLEVNFMDGTGIIRRQQEAEICSMCISNNTIRVQTPKVFNKNK